jgi:hypothetical protein
MGCLGNGYRSFRGIYYLSVTGTDVNPTLRMDAEISPDILEMTYKTRRCFKAEKDHLNSNSHKKLKTGLIGTTKGEADTMN